MDICPCPFQVFAKKPILISLLLLLVASKALGALDRNQDGISDVWSSMHPSAGLPSADPDGDRMNNLAESVAGTHPLDNASCFAANSKLDSTADWQITWAGIHGKHYAIACSTNLDAWISCPGEWIGAGSNVEVAVASLSTNPCSFWQLSVRDSDTDGDRLNDWEESRLGTRHDLSDTDADAMPDGWEAWHDLNPLANDAAADGEGDLWDNLFEYEADTDPAASNSIAVPPVIPLFSDTMAEVHPQADARYQWSISGGDLLEVNGGFSIHFTAAQTGLVGLACTLTTGEASTVVAVYTAQVTAVAAPFTPTIVVPGFVLAGQTGIPARVVAQADASYDWTITNGVIASATDSNAIVLTAGSTGSLALVCAVSRSGFTAAATAVVQVVAAETPAWQTPLPASSLPPLNLIVSSDASHVWNFANMLNACEAWIVKPDATALEAQALARHTRVDTNGWPIGLPDGTHLQFGCGYHTSPTSYLHGAFVLTWNGAGEVQFTSSSDDGQNELFLVNDQTNGRIVKLIQTPAKHPFVRIMSSNPTNHVRNMRLWPPTYDGAGLELTTTSNLAPGQITGNLEPAPGQPEPMWHPVYLQHLNEMPYRCAYRFMGWQDMNVLNCVRKPIEWSDRTPPAAPFYNFSAIDRAWNRHPVVGYKQRLGLPFEWMIDLCNEVQKDFWIQVPHTVTPDMIRGLAALVAEKLDPGLRVWFEYSNEFWNGYPPYFAAMSKAQLAAARHFNIPYTNVTYEQIGWGAGHLQGLALKTFQDEWRARGMPDDRMVNVISGFALNPGYNAQELSAAQELDPNLPEVLAITTYFGMGVQFSIYEQHDFGANPGVWPESLYEATKRIVRQDIYNTIPAWRGCAQVASNAGVHLVCYEGGQHMLPMGIGDSSNPDHVDFMEFMYDFQRSRQIGELYTEQYALWKAMGGSSGSQFVDAGGWSFFGYWGAKDYVFTARSNAPKWDAFCSWHESMQGVRAPTEPIGSRPVLPDLSLNGESQIAFDHSFSSAGGDGDVQIELVGGELPPGMTLTQTNSGTARISGTPTTDGLYRFILRALDADYDSDFKTATLSVDPAGTDSNALVLFRGLDIPATLPGGEYIGRYDSTRPYSEIRNASNELVRIYLPFSINDAIFSNETLEVAGTPHVLPPDSPFNMYGGWSLAAVPYPEGEAPQPPGISMFTALFNYQWSAWFGDGTGGPSDFDALLLWRDIQFNDLGGSGNYTFGTNSLTALLQLDLTALPEAGDLVIRFVILDGGVYYLSEAAHTSLQLGDGYFQLADFNNRSEPGKRWAPFTPTADDYAMPPSSQLVFAAHTFTNVQAVGIALDENSPSWHQLFNFSRFIALGQRE